MVKVADYMSSNVLAVSPSDMLSTVRNIMLSKRVGRLIVVDEDNRPVGIVSRTDLALALRQGGPKWRYRRMDAILVREAMSTELTMVSPEDKISDVARLMRERNIGGLPVTEYDRVVGLLARHDVTRCLAERGDPSLKVSEYMNPDVSTVSPTQSIRRVLRLISSNPDRRVVVIGVEGQPIGIITPSDLAFIKPSPPRKSSHAGLREGEYRGGRRRTAYVALTNASDAMASPVYIVREETSVTEAAALMVKNRIGALPVVGRRHALVGLFSKRGVLRAVEELFD